MSIVREIIDLASDDDEFPPPPLLVPINAHASTSFDYSMPSMSASSSNASLFSTLMRTVNTPSSLTLEVNSNAISTFKTPSRMPLLTACGDVSQLSDQIPVKKTAPLTRFVKNQEFKSNGTTDVQIFHPSLDEMNDFTAYLTKIERENGPQLSCGICKIIPPKGWHPKTSGKYDYDAIDKITIYDPVKETSSEVDGIPAGVYIKSNLVYRKTLPASEFREMAFSPKYAAPKRISTIEELEKYYWKNTFTGEPIYGADTPGTLYDDEVTKFNITKLKTMLDLLDEKNIQIRGVNTPYLYFGMYKSTFAWHAEDMDLYSINYVHIGEPKFWYAIPPEAADRFERLAAQFFPEAATTCKAFLRHKMYMLSPQVLRHHGIPFGTMVQYPGEFMITFPRGYHMGFNTGYNIAEATNFAIDRWIDYGKNIVMCQCTNDAVEIDMKPFIEMYRPSEAEEWLKYWYSRRPDCPKAEIQKGVTPEFMNYLYPNMSRSFQFAAVISCYQIQEGMVKKNKLRNVFALKPSLYYDRMFNAAQGKIFPNCAICQYLVPDLGLFSDFPQDYEMPKRTRRYVTNQMLHKNPESDTNDPDDDELLTCDRCSVVVHRHCYAVIPYEHGTMAKDFCDTAKNGVFRCYRCRNRAMDLVEHTICQFCPMRAGALVPSVSGCMNKNLFAHVICSMAHRRSKVVAVKGYNTPFSLSLASEKLLGENSSQNLQEKLNPFHISFNEAYLNVEHTFGTTPRSVQCELCLGMGEGLIQCGLCDDGYPRHMHATCARLLEVIYEARIYPQIILPVCSIHNVEVPPYIKDHAKVAIGEQVRITVDDRTRVGTVIDVQRSEIRHTIDYPDGTRSNDIPTEDIQRCECNERLCDRSNHIYGSIVFITWDDNTIYEGYYRGRSRSITATVRIDYPNDSTEDISVGRYEILKVPAYTLQRITTPLKQQEKTNRGRKRRAAN